jgi:hypothetical protein
MRGVSHGCHEHVPPTPPHSRRLCYTSTAGYSHHGGWWGLAPSVRPGWARRVVTHPSSILQPKATPGNPGPSAPFHAARARTVSLESEGGADSCLSLARLRGHTGRQTADTHPRPRASGGEEDGSDRRYGIDGSPVPFSQFPLSSLQLPTMDKTVKVQREAEGKETRMRVCVRVCVYAVLQHGIGGVAERRCG